MSYGSSARVSHKGDDYNYHKAKLQLSPGETHWQTLLHSLVYTAISFLRTLYSYFRVFPCNVNRLDPVLNVPEQTKPLFLVHKPHVIPGTDIALRSRHSSGCCMASPLTPIQTQLLDSLLTQQPELTCNDESLCCC